jgi:hypothetical protein
MITLSPCHNFQGVPVLVEALVINDALYAGTKTYRHLNIRSKWAWPRPWLGLRRRSVTPVLDETPANPALHQANQALALSSASLGLTTASLVLMQPVLSMVSLPMMLYVFVPTFFRAPGATRSKSAG